MLFENITSIFPEKEIILVLGVLSEKGIGMFEKLIKHARTVITVSPDSYRAMSSEDALRDTLKFNKNAKSFKIVSDGLIYAEKEANRFKNPLIIATGSLYLASDVKNYYSCK